MKTYEDLYKDFIQYQKDNQEISENEYNEILSTTIQINDIINEIVKYGRFAMYSKKWLEENKEDLIKE